jgi:hypothetical protein
MVALGNLSDHPKNRNQHSPEQIQRLAKMYQYHGIRHPIIVSKLSGHIVAGHGRKLAGKKAGLEAMPVVYQDFADETAEYAFIQADNAIALWAELDLSGINSDLPELGPDFDIDMLGIEAFDLDMADKDLEESIYTDKIEIPIYEPKGERPDTRELFELEKFTELLEEINDSDLPEDIKTFLSFAAHRHIVFNYEKIAEYYAHADEKIQNLMERSALVIIDFDKAIENGFAVLSEKIAEAYLDEQAK